MKEEIEQIRQQLENILGEERYQHTLGVMYTASCLAMKYQYSIEKAMMAGLLHDCAKGISNEEKRAECLKYKIEIDDVENQSPFLLHAKLGAYYAEHQYGISDFDILHSIRVHTTACPDMNLLDKIIYIADYIEPNRNQAPHLAALRKEAFEDLDMCLIHILEDTLNYLNEKDFMVSKDTERTYQYYKKEKINE